ncbi:MAG: glycosyltransferase [Tissierellia bacterium]|nr:glycosyltransferase [Tissierellia bacterium]
MKILLTSDWFAPAVNGVVVSFMNLYKELKKQGHDVKILTLSDSDHSYIDGDYYFVRSFGFKVYPDVRATLAFNSSVLDVLIDWKPDIIHSQCEFFTYSFAYRIAKKTGAPLVHTYHTLYEYYTKYLFLNEKVGKSIVRNVMRFRLKNAETVIAPTQKVKNTLLSYDLNENIKVIPTGIDLEKYNKEVPEEKIIDIKKSLKIPLDHKILINIGRVAEEKNLSELVDNFKILKKVCDDISFVIVGDGPYLEKLKAYVESKEIEDIYFTGMIKPDNIIDYYRLGDIFISASISETQGLTYIEALANGLPEVCRKDDAIQGVIEEGYNGFLYKNEAEFVESVKKLLKNDDMRFEFSKNAKDSSEKFNTYNFGLKVSKLYDEVLSNYKPGSRKPAFDNLVRNIKIKGKKLRKYRRN